jgi:signal transduction histidine kinase
LAEKASTENQTSLKELCSSLHGIRQCSLIYKTSERQTKHVKIEPFTGELIPEPVVRSARDPSPFTHQIAMGREQLFPASTNDMGQGEGWVMPKDGKFAVFWKRFVVYDRSGNKKALGERERKPEYTVLVFLLDLHEIGAIACDYLKPKITTLYAPVRAQGGLNRLEGPGGALMAGLEKPPQRAPDLIVPFSSRIGNWQILSWDTFRTNVAYHQPTLFVAGTLTVVLVAAGLILFIQQRRAQRLAEQRVSFVNRVSHELGTPLTNILLNLELGVEALNAERLEETRRRLDFVVEETRRLARLVRNVLVFSRRERGKLKVNPVPCVPDEVIMSVLNQFGPALARAGIAVEHHGAADETILCDTDALAQIVANLVSNVEKYAASGKWLGIESSLVDNALVIRVSDRGPGIPAEAREIIFNPFERVDNSVHEGVTGTGLGLAIARDLAELMGGTLKLVAADNGAVFELRLPALNSP